MYCCFIRPITTVHQRVIYNEFEQKYLNIDIYVYFVKYLALIRVNSNVVCRIVISITDKLLLNVETVVSLL